MNLTKKRILIVGAGPVGLSAAYFLNRVKGVEIQIVQKKQTHNQQVFSKALLVNARTMTIFENTPIGQMLIENSLKLQKMQIYEGTNLRVENNINQLLKSKTKFPFIYIHSQSLTQRVIQSNLAEQGIKVRRNCQLVNIKDHGNSVEVWFKDEPQSKHYDIVLATDGAHSTVRKSLGIKLQGQTLDNKLYLCDAQVEGFTKESGRIYIYPEAVLILIPMKNKTRVIGTVSNFKDYLPKQFKCKEIEWQSYFTINNRTIPKLSYGNVYFAGDAAHVHAPIGGRGCNLGIEDGFCFQMSEYHNLRKPKIQKFVNDVKTASAFLIANKHPKLKKIIPKLMPFLNYFARLRIAQFISGLDYSLPNFEQVKPKL